MNPILFAVLLVSAIGLIAGLGLSVASVVMAVPVDEKAENIRACLPGANCGACGFSGCDGYADALSKGTTADTGLCGPGGKEVAEQIAEITGLAVTETVPSVIVAMQFPSLPNMMPVPLVGKTAEPPDILNLTSVPAALPRENVLNVASWL